MNGVCYMVCGPLGSENATASYEFPDWAACDAWMREHRMPSHWYKIYA